MANGYSTYASPINRMGAIAGVGGEIQRQKFERREQPMREGIMRNQQMAGQIANQSQEQQMRMLDQQLKTSNLAADAFELINLDDQQLIQGLQRKMPDFYAMAAKENAPIDEIRNRLGGIVQRGAMLGAIKLPEAPKQPTSVQEFEYAQQNPQFAEHLEAQRQQSSPTFSKPFEVTGPDGQPLLVRQDPQTGALVPVQGFKPALGSTETIETGPDGTVRIVRGKGVAGSGGDLQRSVSSDLQKKIIGAERMLVRLDEVTSPENFDPRILTYWGQAQNAIAKTKDKLGMDLNTEERELLQKAVKTKEGINQIWNDYRREITGAAASVQELSSLREAVLNTNQSPEQFAAAVERFRTQVQNDIALYRRFLEQGFSPEQAGKALDATKPDAAAKEAEEVKTLSDDELLKQLNGG